MAIVMLRDLPGGEVPGTGFTRSDLSTYVHIENAAKNVLQGCLSPVLGRGKGRGGELGFVNPTGYDIAGMCMVHCVISRALVQLEFEKGRFHYR